MAQNLLFAQNPSPPDGPSPLLLSMKDMLMKLPLQPHSTAYLYRVPREFRKGNEHYYTPTTVSIGPLHAANPNLDAADGQQLKSRALQHLLCRSHSEPTLESLIQFLKGIEATARLCYAETIDLSSDEFVKMMLLDGCFILALLTSDYPTPVGRERELFLNIIQKDLLLLENQLPLFVLEGLFEQAGLDLPKSQSDEGYFYKYAFKFFLPIMPNQFFLPKSELLFFSVTPPRHLLELFLLSVFPPPQKNTILVDFYRNLFRKMNLSELAMYGIKPYSSYHRESITNITFSNGLLKIPRLSIHESTTSLFKNLLVLEKCSGDQTHSCFESYICLLDTLIDTIEDVEQLVSGGVLEPTINDKKALVSLLSDLATNNVSSNNVSSDVRNTHFIHVYWALEFYCDSRPARWRANFQRYYYESRWDILNSILLFILTITQTLFAILSYKPKN